MNEIFSTCGICHGKIGLIPCNCVLAKKLTDDIKYDITIKWDGKTTHHLNVSLDTPLHYNESKTLTDEEINEIFSKTWLDLKDYKDFARAILRKAQEK